MDITKTYRMGIGIFVLVLLMTTVTTGALVRTWDGGGTNSFWATPANWNPDGYNSSYNLIVLSGTPTSIDAVVADNGGSITLDGSAAIADFSYILYIAYTSGASGQMDVLNGANVSNTSGYLGYNSDASGTATVSGVGSTWTNSGDLNVGDYGTGALSITDGGAVSNVIGRIGYSNDSSGTATISGAGSRWTNSSNLYVGHGGTGVLNINTGGTVTNTYGYLGYESGSSGTATVSGTGSTWTNSKLLSVGDEGTGVLSIIDGGSVSNTTGYLGHHDGDASGTVTVSGAGSRWTNSSYLYVGRTGRGTLSITDGGAVSSANCYLGYNNSGSGTATVGGAGAAWTNTSILYVGYEGTGVLSITDGGTVSNAIGRLGGYSGASGEVTVSGAGSTWTNSGSLYVGGAGTGTVTIRTGGTVSIGDELNIGAAGTVNVNGGAIRFTRPDPLTVVPGGAFNFNAGTLGFDCDLDVVNDSTHVVNQVFGQSGYYLQIPHSSCLDVTGQMTLMMNTHLNGGTLSVGSLWGADALSFNSGTFKLTDANLTIGMGGLFGRILNLNSAQTIEVTNEAIVASTGLLEISGGAFSADTTINFGEIQLISSGYGYSGDTPLLAGGSVENYGFISGDGRISADLNNTATGMVSIASGGELLFTGSLNDNYGTIVNSGGFLGATGLMTNAIGANINAVGEVTLSLTGGLDNSGTVSLSAAEANVYGDITNNSDALVALANESEASFVGAFVNNGDVYVGQDSRAVFFGPVSGSGTFSGSGTVEFADSFSPGSSPAIVSFGGDVVFTGSLTLEIELGGMTPGTEHDGIDVGGSLSLAGTLDVVLIDNFDPELGDTFDLLDWGSLTDQFNTVNLPGLSGGLTWDDSSLYSTGEITVVPEPASAVLLLSGGVLVMFRRRKSRA